jgi:hypothetical protein
VMLFFTPPLVPVHVSIREPCTEGCGARLPPANLTDVRALRDEAVMVTGRRNAATEAVGRGNRHTLPASVSLNPTPVRVSAS